MKKLNPNKNYHQHIPFSQNPIDLLSYQHRIIVKSETKTQMSNPFIQQLFKSRIHILEVMKINGYDTAEYEGFSLLEVDTMASQKMMDILLVITLLTTRPQLLKKSSLTRDRFLMTYHLSPRYL
jgi:hypothetical protein